ncbi:hypothetical protein PJP07_30620, partial [Mycobacterium kansasii]
VRTRRGYVGPTMMYGLYPLRSSIFSDHFREGNEKTRQIQALLDHNTESSSDNASTVETILWNKEIFIYHPNRS